MLKPDDTPLEMSVLESVGWRDAFLKASLRENAAVVLDLGLTPIRTSTLTLVLTTAMKILQL